MLIYALGNLFSLFRAQYIFWVMVSFFPFSVLTSFNSKIRRSAFRHCYCIYVLFLSCLQAWNFSSHPTKRIHVYSNFRPPTCLFLASDSHEVTIIFILLFNFCLTLRFLFLRLFVVVLLFRVILMFLKAPRLKKIEYNFGIFVCRNG